MYNNITEDYLTKFGEHFNYFPEDHKDYRAKFIKFLKNKEDAYSISGYIWHLQYPKAYCASCKWGYKGHTTGLLRAEKLMPNFYRFVKSILTQIR